MSGPLWLDILGGGGVALAFLKEAMRAPVWEHVAGCRVWKKASSRDQGGLSSSLFEDTLSLHLASRPPVSPQPTVRYYSELGELQELSATAARRRERGGRAVLLLLTRYDLQGIAHSSDSWAALSPRARAEAEATFRSAAADLAVHRQRCAAVSAALRAFAERSRIRPARLDKLQESIPAIYELAHVLTGYPGTVFNFVNEVGATGKVLAEAGGIDPRRVISPSQHDVWRVMYALRRRLAGEGVREVTCEVLGPHNNLAFVPETRLRLDGRPLDALPQARAHLDEVVEWSTRFGQRLFEAHGTSNEDSTTALVAALAGLAQPAACAPFRAVCHHSGEDVFIGLPGRFDQGGRFHPGVDVLAELTESGTARWQAGVQEQRRLDGVLRRALRAPHRS